MRDLAKNGIVVHPKNGQLFGDGAATIGRKSEDLSRAFICGTEDRTGIGKRTQELSRGVFPVRMVDFSPAGNEVLNGRVTGLLHL